MIKYLSKKAVLFETICPPLARIRSRREIRDWYKSGKPAPPPPALKQFIVREFGAKFGLRVFVETGTYMGDMVHALRKDFRKIYSIELDQTLYQNAKARFRDCGNISIIHGDSSEVLSPLLSGIHEPCLFWLDGHFSGGTTAKGQLETPIMAELRYIGEHSVKNHVILIDDARCFTGRNNYPTIPELHEFIKTMNPGAVIEIIDDIIRIYPRTANE